MLFGKVLTLKLFHRRKRIAFCHYAVMLIHIKRIEEKLKAVGNQIIGCKNKICFILF